MGARLRRTEESRNKYRAVPVPDVIELSADKDKDLLVGRLPLSEGQPKFCDAISMECYVAPRLLSHQHSYIFLDDEGCHCIRDLDTLNGTYVNGNVIPDKNVKLKKGDVIGFGGPRYVTQNRHTVANLKGSSL